MQLPDRGLPREEIFAHLEAARRNDKPWASGKVLGYVYDPGEAPKKVNQDAYLMYLTENALDPTTFPSVMQLERDVVRAVVNLLRGDAGVVGSFTSGGTESILLAVKTARDKTRAERGIANPEMILPCTAHSAFHKAAAYFDVKAVVVDVDPVSFRADVDAMRRAITQDTMLLVGSAPGYGHGVVDPIPQIGALALEHGLLCHVDACVGGIHLSFMREIGYNPPAFDWSVPGVTSISTDLHKFGYAAKQASIVMYRDKALRRYQFFACRRSTTYALINSTILSSKSGGPVAGAWAILNFLGREGYHRIVRDVQEATRRMIDGVRAMPGLRVLGEPDMCMFSFTTEGMNLFHLADAMTRRGWYLQPQFQIGQYPVNLHVTMTQLSVPLVDQFLADLAAALDEVRALENPIDAAMVKTQIQGLVASGGGDAFAQLSAMAGISGASDLPEEMALINTVLDALPADLAEGLLIDYLNDLYV